MEEGGWDELEDQVRHKNIPTGKQTASENLVGSTGSAISPLCTPTTYS